MKIKERSPQRNKMKLDYHFLGRFCFEFYAYAITGDLNFMYFIIMFFQRGHPWKENKSQLLAKDSENFLRIT